MTFSHRILIRWLKVATAEFMEEESKPSSNRYRTQELILALQGTRRLPNRFLERRKRESSENLLVQNTNNKPLATIKNFVLPFSPNANSGGIIAWTFWPTFISLTIELIPLFTAVLSKKYLKTRRQVVCQKWVFSTSKRTSISNTFVSYLPNLNRSAFFFPTLCVASKIAPFVK